MKPSALFLLLALGFGVPQTSQGQRIAGSPRAAESLRINALVNAPRELPRTYWLEGGVAGAIALGLLTTALAEGFCDADSNCSGATAGSFVVGGTVGFVVGALVGGQFRKAPRDTTAVR
jgi:hypothetical protein